MKTAFGFLALLLAVQFCCCGGWLTPTPTAPAEQPAQACSPTNMVGWPLDYVTAEGGCVYKAPQSSNSPAEQPAAKTVTFPATVWRNDVANKDSRYDIVFDPNQGGSPDHPAYGWYRQPALPSPENREAHEVALILRGPARYRFTGPECQVYWNYDNNHPFNTGRLIINASNGEYTIQPTTGNEAYIFVVCNAGWSSGFSFEALEQLP